MKLGTLVSAHNESANGWQESINDVFILNGSCGIVIERNSIHTKMRCKNGPWYKIYFPKYSSYIELISGQFKII